MRGWETEGGTVSEGLIQREVPSVRVMTEGGTVSEGYGQREVPSVRG